MKIDDILAIAIASLIVIVAVVRTVRSFTKNDKGGCDCGCGGCH